MGFEKGDDRLEPVKKQRIWEVDAFRGFCLLFVFASHLLFDLGSVFRFPVNPGAFLTALFHYGGAVFILVSGLSATLGSRSFRRGLIVLGCGLLITLVSEVMIALGFLPAEDRIQFGVLHLIGICMILYPILRKLPTVFLAIFGAVLLGLGFRFSTILLARPASAYNWRSFLFVFGLRTEGFASGDYFPLLPNLGWFIEGIVLGRLVYKDKVSLLPNFPSDFFLIRFLRFLGRHSLIFYLLHQPVFFGLILLTERIISHFR